MFVSVIIPTRNRKEHVTRAVNALLGQDYNANAFEVIVCCDGCTDGSEEALSTIADRRLNVISIPATGQVAALNAAVRAAKGELAIFLDDEMEATPDMIRAHVLAHRDAQDRRTAITGYASVAIPANAPRSMQSLADDYARYYEGLGRPDHASGPPDLNGGHFSVPIAALREVGCFNESYVFQRNDFELAVRWLERGYRIGYAKDARATMHVCLTADTLIGRARARGRADFRLAREHPWCIPWLPFHRALTNARSRRRWHLAWIAAPVSAGVFRTLRRLAPDRLQQWCYLMEYCAGLRLASGSWRNFVGLSPHQ
ncbi:MAG: glycosyltransferase family 2 protein [Proteobacteria bacterium]|nr:glycosyltransferase family 2 protein [Pseudomonadota bacterium]